MNVEKIETELLEIQKIKEGFQTSIIDYAISKQKELFKELLLNKYLPNSVWSYEDSFLNPCELRFENNSISEEEMESLLGKDYYFDYQLDDGLKLIWNYDYKILTCEKDKATLLKKYDLKFDFSKKKVELEKLKQKIYNIEQEIVFLYSL